jgi:hypothetical protein
MDQELIAKVRVTLEGKTTAELRQAYEARDQSAWSPEAFEAMRQILAEREEAGPGQPSRPPTGRALAPAGGVGEALLTFGQIVSVLGCIAAPISGIVALSGSASACVVVVGATLGFLYSAAMFVVFSRVKRVPPG